MSPTVWHLHTNHIKLELDVNQFMESPFVIFIFWFIILSYKM